MSSVAPGAIEIPFDEEEAPPVVSARTNYSDAFERKAVTVTPGRYKSVVDDDECDSESGGGSTYFLTNPNHIPSASFMPKYHEQPDPGILSVTSDATTEVTATTNRVPQQLLDKYTSLEGEHHSDRQPEWGSASRHDDGEKIRYERRRRGHKKTRDRRRTDSSRRSSPDATRTTSRKKKANAPSKHTTAARESAGSVDTDPTAEPSDTSGEATFNSLERSPSRGRKKVRFSRKTRRHSRRRQLVTRKRGVGDSQCCKTVVDEVEGFVEDTLTAFDQIFNVFTLEEKDIQAVAGRIDKAKKQLT